MQTINIIKPIRNTRKHRVLALATLALAVPFGLNSTQAAVITWGASQNIAGDSDVNITGTSVYAYHFGNGGPDSVNGVSFAAAGTGGGGTDITIGGGAPPLYAGPYFSSSPPLSAEYTTVLLGGLYTAFPFGTYSLNLNNLDSGTAYTVQVWSRSPYSGQHITLDGAVNDLLSNNGTGQYMIGTFTADAATQTITVGPGVGDSSGGPLNALQVRAVPEPGAALLGGLGLAALLRRRRNPTPRR